MEKRKRKKATSGTFKVLLFAGVILWYAAGEARSARFSVSNEYSGTRNNKSSASSLLSSLGNQASQTAPKEWQNKSKKSSMTCVPNSASRPRTPLIIFASGRTGSRLFLSIITKVCSHADSKAETDLLQLKALFKNYSIDSTYQVSAVVQALADSCHQDLQQFQGQFLDGPWKTEQAVKSLQTQAQGQPLLSKWLDLHQHRRDRAVEVVEFVANIPSQARNPIVALKIFKNHVSTKENFLSEIMAKARSGSMNTPKFVILWRRRMIESFVSREIARKTSDWMRADTGNQVVKVEKDALESYLNETKQNFTSVRDHLDLLQVPYEVFEYSRDLLHDEGKLKTIHRLQRLLNLTQPGNGTPQDILAKFSVYKQSSVPLSQQVSNWDEVVSWGYGGDLNEWEDLFAPKDATKRIVNV